MPIHPKDSVEPPDKFKAGPNKKSKSSAKRSAKKSGSKTDLVDQDPYQFMSRKRHQLTPLERKFIDSYVDCVGTVSAKNEEDYAIIIAINIGIEDYNAKRWSKATLGEPAVQRAINDRALNQAKSQEITKERLLAEYARIAFGNVGDILDLSEGGHGVKIKSFTEMGSDALATIKSIKEVNGEKSSTLTVEQHDKMRALDILMKHLGLLNDENQRESPEEIAIRALKAAKIMSEMSGGK